METRRSTKQQGMGSYLLCIHLLLYLDQANIRICFKQLHMTGALGKCNGQQVVRLDSLMGLLLLDTESLWLLILEANP